MELWKKFNRILGKNIESIQVKNWIEAANCKIVVYKIIVFCAVKLIKSLNVCNFLLNLLHIFLLFLLFLLSLLPTSFLIVRLYFPLKKDWVWVFFSAVFSRRLWTIDNPNKMAKVLRSYEKIRTTCEINQYFTKYLRRFPVKWDELVATIDGWPHTHTHLTPKWQFDGQLNWPLSR